MMSEILSSSNFNRIERNQATCKVLLSLFLCVSFAAQSFAVEVLSPNAKQNIEREQKARLQQLEQAKESIEALQPLPELQPPSSPIEEGTCFDVNRIQFTGNTVFTSEELLALINFEPSCVGLNDINNYLRIITNAYVSDGYVTSRAFLVPQDLNSGELTIVVMEGKVEALLFNGQPSNFLSNALPDVLGNVLNLRDIEQGLDQINRLSRYNAKIALPPGKEQGFSIVDIQSTVGGISSFSFGFNNSGQDSTGEEQVSTTVSVENVADILDKWTLSASKSAEFNSDKDAQNIALAVDVPMGYWNISYRTSYSDYKRTIQNNSFQFESTGRTNSHDADLSRLFYRDGDSKANVKLGVHHRIEKNYILGNLLKTGSRSLSSLSFSLDYSRRLAGGFFSIAPRWVIGTDWFGGEEDTQKTSVMPKAQFTKSTFTTSYSYPINPKTRLSSTLFGQWSDDTLFGNERLSIGGLYSVRGFKDVSISGDQGYYWRNDITHQLGQYPYIGDLSAQWALDTGSIVKDDKDTLEKGSLLGSSLSINTRNSKFSSQLSIGVPLEAPSRLKADDYVIYYQLNLAI